jgi:hypothetical protein
LCPKKSNFAADNVANVEQLSTVNGTERSFALKDGLGLKRLRPFDGLEFTCIPVGLLPASD